MLPFPDFFPLYGLELLSYCLLSFYFNLKTSFSISCSLALSNSDKLPSFTLGRWSRVLISSLLWRIVLLDSWLRVSSFSILCHPSLWPPWLLVITVVNLIEDPFVHDESLRAVFNILSVFCHFDCKVTWSGSLWVCSVWSLFYFLM